jgi:alkaline phosphatase
LTLNDNFPQLLAQKGAEALTDEDNPTSAGHFWGSDPNVKYGWGNHSNRMVPVYYQGGTSTLSRYIGKGYKAYGFDVPGVPSAVDQVHIFQAMRDAITEPARNP